MTSSSQCCCRKKKKSMLLKKPDNQSRSSQISVEVKQAHIKTGSPRDLIKGLQQYFPDVSWEFSLGLIFFSSTMESLWDQGYTSPLQLASEHFISWMSSLTSRMQTVIHMSMSFLCQCHSSLPWWLGWAPNESTFCYGLEEVLERVINTLYFYCVIQNSVEIIESIILRECIYILCAFF